MLMDMILPKFDIYQGTVPPNCFKTKQKLLMSWFFFQKKSIVSTYQPRIKFSKRGGGGELTGPQFLEGGSWEIESCSFLHKKTNQNLKYLMTKKSLLTKMFFYVITKNLKWDILTKNFLPFKRWDGVKDKKF